MAICKPCGSEYEKYRPNQRACSTKCYRNLDDVKAKDKLRKSKPEVREKKNAARRIENNPERRVVNRINALKAYGLTLEDFDQMKKNQNNRCAICNSKPRKNGHQTVTKLSVDHCHDTGQVRGLLCNNCNRALGYFQDNAEIIKLGYEYLMKWR